ncbi:MAG: hypothetical protein Q9196_006957 [Gyalolechia fulgens]
MSCTRAESSQKPREDFSFATLTPFSKKAIDNFACVTDAIRKQPSEFTHHSYFCRFDNPSVPRSDYPRVLRPEPQYKTPALCTEIWLVYGKGKWEQDRRGEVDLLIAGREEVYPRHINFRFDVNGRLQLLVRHGGIELDGEPLARGSSRILSHTNFVKIGPLSYRFAYTVPKDEEPAFQKAKIDFLKENIGLQQEPNELISATPSATDLRIGDWVIKGTAGFSATSVIEAASNVRTAEIVAVKRMRRSNNQSAQKIQQELDIYEKLRPIKDSKNGQYVMYMHSALYKTDKDWHGSPDEVYLLWYPLALKPIQLFSSTGKWASVAYEVKVTLFCQVCLGIQAVHQMGWIHRDIKPLNLYVVTLLPPYAVVGDFGSAVLLDKSGLIPQPGHHGTIGFLAPELENPAFAPRYTQMIDVWSLGAVAYFLFISDYLPWVSRYGHNTFLHEDDPAWDLFRDLMGNLSSSGPETLKGLLRRMLEPRPTQRYNLLRVLAHPVLQSSMHSLESNSAKNASTGSKRPAI